MTFLHVKILNSSNFRYTQNGILHMLDRNKRIKPRPERFQNCKDVFDLILTCEERVYDQVVEGKELQLINQINFGVFFPLPWSPPEIWKAPDCWNTSEVRSCSYWWRFIQHRRDGWAEHLSPKGAGSSSECVCTARKSMEIHVWFGNGAQKLSKLGMSWWQNKCELPSLQDSQAVYPHETPPGQVEWSTGSN